jgi:hypothetical protein
MEAKIYTRKEHMAPRPEAPTKEEDRRRDNEAHRRFYAQFITESMRCQAKRAVHRAYDGMPERIDGNLNLIDRKSNPFWDSYLPGCSINLEAYNLAYEKTGNSVYVSDKFCALKEAAKQYLEELGYVDLFEFTNGYWECILVRKPCS